MSPIVRASFCTHFGALFTARTTAPACGKTAGLDVAAFADDGTGSTVVEPAPSGPPHLEPHCKAAPERCSEQCPHPIADQTILAPDDSRHVVDLVRQSVNVSWC